jgi:hypothetical protein
MMKELGNPFQKSRYLVGFETSVGTVPSCAASILDGSAMIYILAPRTSRTFDEYSATEVIPKIQATASKYDRNDIIIVFDVYYVASSLKTETGTRRGRGSRYRVTDSTKAPKLEIFHEIQFQQDRHFNYLAEQIVKMGSNDLI